MRVLHSNKLYPARSLSLLHQNNIYGRNENLSLSTSDLRSEALVAVNRSRCSTCVSLIAHLPDSIRFDIVQIISRSLSRSFRRRMFRILDSHQVRREVVSSNCQLIVVEASEKIYNKVYSYF